MRDPRLNRPWREHFDTIEDFVRALAKDVDQMTMEIFSRTPEDYAREGRVFALADDPPQQGPRDGAFLRDLGIKP